MHYELWDAATGNCIGRYATEHEAVARVKNLGARFGTAYADDLKLAAEDDLGTFRGTRTGPDLLPRLAEVLAEQSAAPTLPIPSN